MFDDKKHIYYTLRFASALCFIGHGAFGIIGKAVWCNYFAVFGIAQPLAWHLMPLVGTMDILLGCSLLFYPTRPILGWLVLWGTVTALCRPLSGEPFAEFIERAGNFGAPLALLLLYDDGRPSSLFSFRLLEANFAGGRRPSEIVNLLKMIVFLVLFGHGWLNISEKKALLDQYAGLGFRNPVAVAHAAGVFEMLAAGLTLVRPLRAFVFAFLLWKMGSELFYRHWEFFEWVERGGSYGAVLALWLALPRRLSEDKQIKPVHLNSDQPILS